jgi:hypothetical protein
MREKSSFCVWPPFFVYKNSYFPPEAMEISYNKFALRLLWGKIWEQKISVSTIPYPNYVKAKVIDWFLHTLSLSRHTHFSFVYERREKNEKRIVENIAQNHSTCRLLRIFCWQHKNKIKNWLKGTFSTYSRSNFHWNGILIRILWESVAQAVVAEISAAAANIVAPPSVLVRTPPRAFS